MEQKSEFVLSAFGVLTSHFILHSISSKCFFAFLTFIKNNAEPKFKKKNKNIENYLHLLLMNLQGNGSDITAKIKVLFVKGAINKQNWLFLTSMVSNAFVQLLKKITDIEMLYQLYVKQCVQSTIQHLD